MSVYLEKGRKTYRYDFRYGGRHYKGNTYQETEADARAVEAKLRLELRQRRGGIAPAVDPPSFASWAGVHWAHLVKLQKRTGKPKRLDRMDELLRVVLRFWGRRPTDPASKLLPLPGEEAPFHDLTLGDPIDDPTWILKFDDWMDRRGIAGDTRNHYNSMMSQLYVVAMLPEYRKTTGVILNPFAGRPRAPHGRRKVALKPDQVIAWIGQMSYHARLAVSIAALAPKFRLANVLGLRWDEHIDRDLTTITVHDHKSALVTGEPLETPISAQLQAILKDARARNPKATYVVTYRGKRVKQIRGAVKAAAADAGIPYGRHVPRGVTFHTLRHSAATILARLAVNPWLQRDALGHRDLSTSAGYTHLLVEEQRSALEALSAELPIADVVTAPQRRATRKRPGGISGGTAVPKASKRSKFSQLADRLRKHQMRAKRENPEQNRTE